MRLRRSGAILTRCATNHGQSPPLRQRGCEIRVRFLCKRQQEFTTSTGEIEPVILRSGRAQALSNAKPRYPRTRPKAKRIHLSRMKGAIHIVCCLTLSRKTAAPFRNVMQKGFQGMKNPASCGVHAGSRLGGRMFCEMVKPAASLPVVVDDGGHEEHERHASIKWDGKAAQ